MLRDELLIIVGTSSSETVLPRLLAKLEAAGASRQTVGMVIPTGYSFNLDGTCIYLTLGALFIVQAAGQDMAIGEQLALAGADDPHLEGRRGHHRRRARDADRSLQAFGGTFFTAESIAVGIALVVGIDRIMSEGRALTNCIGNGVATMVVASWQGERDDERFQAALRDPTLVEEATERALRGERATAPAASAGASSASPSARAGDRRCPADHALRPGATARRRRSSRGATRPAAAARSAPLGRAVVGLDEVRRHHGGDLARRQRVRERGEDLGHVLARRPPRRASGRGWRSRRRRPRRAGSRRPRAGARRGARRSATAPCSGRRRRCSAALPWNSVGLPAAVRTRARSAW